MSLEYPLTKANRIRLARAFKHVPRVDFSIDCILEAQMGRAFVDDIHHPTAFKIEVGPFCYFAGEATSSGGLMFLKNIAPYTLLMPSSPGWIQEAKSLYGEQLVTLNRYSFSSEHISSQHLDHLCQISAFKGEVKRMDVPFVTQLWGQDHFVDLSDFDSPEDFVQRGIGFYLEKKGTVVGAAFSSLVCSKGIEVSLFVLEDQRRQGIATILASHLIKWCLANNADAHWDAANPESCKLAEKLGYVQTGEYQAYYLKT